MARRKQVTCAGTLLISCKLVLVQFVMACRSYCGLSQRLGEISLPNSFHLCTFYRCTVCNRSGLKLFMILSRWGKVRPSTFMVWWLKCDRKSSCVVNKLSEILSSLFKSAFSGHTLRCLRCRLLCGIFPFNPCAVSFDLFLFIGILPVFGGVWPGEAGLVCRGETAGLWPIRSALRAQHSLLVCSHPERRFFVFF